MAFLDLFGKKKKYHFKGKKGNFGRPIAHSNAKRFGFSGISSKPDKIDAANKKVIATYARTIKCDECGKMFGSNNPRAMYAMYYAHKKKEHNYDKKEEFKLW